MTCGRDRGRDCDRRRHAVCIRVSMHACVYVCVYVFNQLCVMYVCVTMWHMYI